MTDSPVGDMIGLALGVGFGLTALNMVNKVNENMERRPSKRKMKRREEDDFLPNMF